MAYTASPEFNTYKTVPIAFDGNTTYRSGDLTTQRDINVVNFFYDRISQENKTRETWLKKRPGLATTAYSLSRPAPTDSIRGFFYDSANNRLYWAVANKVFSANPDTNTTIRTVCTLATSSGYVGFCEFFKSSTNTRYVIISDGTDLWVDDVVGASCVEVTDVDLPSPHVPQPISLDGYVFLAKENTGDLYNSDNDDPTAWTPGDYISTEMSGDFIVKIVQNRNYIVAFGSNSMEMFWDAANTSGSPLRRNDVGYKDIGYVTGMAKIGKNVFFVGQDSARNNCVYMIDGFDVNKVSTSVVDRSIQAIATTDNSKGSVYLDTNGYALSIDGHTFYVLRTPQTTWMFDNESNFWYELRGSDGTNLKIEASWSMYNGMQYVAIVGQTYISKMSPSLYQDFGSNFTCTYTTERVTGGSLNFSVCNKVTLGVDRQVNTGESNVVLSWSDNDWYSTTGSRNINVFKEAPKAYSLGQFRTRSFRITYADNYPIRLKGMELELNVGTH